MEIKSRAFQRRKNRGKLTGEGLKTEIPSRPECPGEHL